MKNIKNEKRDMPSYSNDIIEAVEFVNTWKFSLFERIQIFFSGKIYITRIISKETHINPYRISINSDDAFVMSNNILDKVNIKSYEMFDIYNTIHENRN